MIAAIALFSLNVAFACPGEATMDWLNPDGSTGGKVSYAARVASQVFVAPGASICGQSWVDGVVRLEGESQIGDEAWVGPFVRLTGSAKVGGHARVQGLAAHIQVLLADKAMVQGRARIQGKAEIAGNAIVEGEVSIGSHVRIEGGARVCEPVRLETMTIVDSQFCLQTKAESRADVIRSGVRAGGYNAPDAELILDLEKGYLFNVDEGQYLVSVNGMPVERADLRLWRNRVRFKFQDYVRAGENTLTYKFIDQYRHTIAGSFDFIVSEEDLAIPLTVPAGVEARKLKAKAFFWDEGEKFELTAKVDPLSGDLLLKGIPAGAESVLSTVVVGEGVIAVATFEKSNLPDQIELKDFPDVQRISNLDFSSGLLGWEHGGDGEVAVSEDQRLALSPASVGQVYAATSFTKMSDGHVVPTGVGFSDGPTSSRHVATAVLFNSTSQEFSVNHGTTLGGATAAQVYLKGAKKGDEVTVLYAVDTLDEAKAYLDIFAEKVPASVSLFADLSVVALKNPNQASQYVQAIPLFSPLESCPQNTERIPYNSHEDALRRGINFLSTGPLPSYWTGRATSRIYGYIAMNGAAHRAENIQLSIQDSDGRVLGTARLSACAKDIFNRQAVWKRVDPLGGDNREAQYLFELPPLGEMTAEGRLTLIVEDTVNGINWRVRRQAFPLVDYSFAEIASSPYSASSRDLYDNNNPGASRGGGDSWGRIVYKNTWRAILADMQDGWTVNDISLMHGARFRSTTSTHSTGQDGDFSFAGYCQNCTLQEEFNKAERIRNNLEGLSAHFGRIQDIYLEPADVESEVIPEGEVQSGLWKSLANRCIGGRVIDPSILRPNSEEPRTAGHTGSLAIVREPHQNHLHIRLHEAPPGTVMPNLPQRAVVARLDDFTFALTPGVGHYTLTARRRGAASPELRHYRLAVRLQSDTNLTHDTRVVVHSAQAPSGSAGEELWTMQIPVDPTTGAIATPHASIVLWDKQPGDGTNFPGGCQAFQVSLDELCAAPTKDPSFQDWFFHVNGDGTAAVVADGNEVTNSYVQAGSKICGEGVVVQDSDIRDIVSIRNGGGAKRGRTPNLSLNDLSVPVLEKGMARKTGAVLDIQADGTMEDVEFSGMLEIRNYASADKSGSLDFDGVKIQSFGSTPAQVYVNGSWSNVDLKSNVDIQGFMDLTNVTADNLLAGTGKIKIRNLTSYANRSKFNNLTISGYPDISSKVYVFGEASYMTGPVKIIGKDVAGDAVVLSDATLISNTKMTGNLLLDASERAPLMVTSSTIDGTPTIKHALHIKDSAILGAGTYIGLNNDWAPALQSYMEGLFTGGNAFSGYFYLRRSIDGSTISNTPTEVDGYKTCVVLNLRETTEAEDPMENDVISGATLTGAISVDGIIEDGVLLNGIAYAGPYRLNINLGTDVSVRGAGTSITGSLFADGVSSITSHTSPDKRTVTPSELSLTDAWDSGYTSLLTASGTNPTARPGTHLSGVTVNNKVRAYGSTVTLGTLEGSPSLYDSSLLSSSIYGTSCVQNRTWTEETRTDVPCVDPLLKRKQDQVARAIMEGQRRTEASIKGYAAEAGSKRD